jgi:phosphopantetheinyl transferase
MASLETWPLPTFNDLHLWFSPHSSDDIEALLQTVDGIISTEEQDRLQSFQSEAAAQRFLLGRLLLRRILGGYLNIHPGRLDIATDANGKPYLVQPAPVQFNMAHDSTDVVIAVTRDRAVGIDIAAVNRSAAVLLIAQQCFSTAEKQQIKAAGDQAELAALRFWVLKESAAKAIGGTIWESLENMSFSLCDAAIDWASAPPVGRAVDWCFNAGRYRGKYLLAVACFAEQSKSTSTTPLTLRSRVYSENGPQDEAFIPDLVSRTL